MPSALPLSLRNRLAELILDALDSGEARETLSALVRTCAGEAVDSGPAARLVALGWFDPASAGRIRLRGAHEAHREALCGRAAAALRMLERATPSRDGDTLVARLDRAARLADAGLFFEVHELLEPAWLRAEGAERLGLQGLIQVAVGFHHAAHGNREGALSLLGEGLAKLRAAGPALPLDAGTWLGRLENVLTTWRAGRPASPPEPWPAPTEAAWRSS
jgi:Domain of unknown function (DUF309)